MNLRRWGKRILLSICDVDVLGRTLKLDKIVFCIQKEFYKGSLVSLEEALELIGQSTIVNMVGRNIVEKAVKEGLIHPDAVLEIEGVPHAQIVKL